VGHSAINILIVESEPAEGLSTHKLLIETAKHNVLTAYSGREGLEMLQRFPDVDAIVFDTALEDLTCEQFTREVQKQNSKCKIIGLKHRDRAQGIPQCGYKEIFSDDPAGLLKMLEEEFGG
jgi:DNA-binding response OmpR family regulator